MAIPASSGGGSPPPDDEFGCRTNLVAMPPLNAGLDGCDDDDCTGGGSDGPGGGGGPTDGGCGGKGDCEKPDEPPADDTLVGCVVPVPGSNREPGGGGGGGGASCSGCLCGYSPSIGNKSVQLEAPSNGPIAPKVVLTYDALSTDSTFFGFGFSDRNSRWIEEITPHLAEIHSGDGRVSTYTRASVILDPPVPYFYDLPAKGANSKLENLITGWIETRRNGFKMEYNASGDLVKTTTVAGSISTFSYTGTPPRLQTIVDPSGGRTTYTYGGSPTKIQSVTDTAGRVTAFEVNASDNLVKYTSPELCVTSLTYDGQHRITSITDPEGNRSTFAYDSSSKLTSFGSSAESVGGICIESEPNACVF